MLSETTAETQSAFSPECLSRHEALVEALTPVTPLELGRLTSAIRTFLNGEGFSELVLSPIDRYPIDYRGIAIDVPGIGQLRFNTEPEIWEVAGSSERFYSVSTLFRREPVTNPLRLPAFQIVDFYQMGTPASLFSTFRSLMRSLSDAGLTHRLNRLPVEEARFDPVGDGPGHAHDGFCLCITDGYDAEHSFFEIDDNGQSTRREVFLITPQGHVELGVFGITGYNHNPHYHLRDADQSIRPNLQRSGFCIGLERLLLAEKVLSLLD